MIETDLKSTEDKLLDILLVFATDLKYSPDITPRQIKEKVVPALMEAMR